MAGDEEDESFSLGSGRPHIDTTPRKPAPESDGSQADPATPDEKKEPEVRRAEPVTESEDALDHALRAQKEERIIEEQNLKQQQQAQMDLQQLYSDPVPKMPSFEETYPSPTLPPGFGQTNNDLKTAMMRYAAVALPLAFAFGARGGGWAGGAAKAFAEGLEGVKAGYLKKSQQGYALWKYQNDMAIEQGEHKMTYYKDVIANRTMNMTEKKEQIQAMAKYWGDSAIAAKAITESYHSTVDILENREKLLSDAIKARAEAEGKLATLMGSTEEQKEYLAYLARKSMEGGHPELAKEMEDAVQGKQGASFAEAYWKATKLYPFKEFHDARRKEKLEEIEAEARGRAAAGVVGKSEGKKQARVKKNPADLNLGPDFEKQGNTHELTPDPGDKELSPHGD